MCGLRDELISLGGGWSITTSSFVEVRREESFMAVAELLQLGIADVLKHIRARELSPVELVRAYLEQIERLNPALNVYLTVMAKGALAAAKAAEQAVMNGETLGVLHEIGRASCR